MVPSLREGSHNSESAQRAKWWGPGSGSGRESAGRALGTAELAVANPVLTDGRRSLARESSGLNQLE